MKSIKSGDVFVFSVDSKYGLIQVIKKSKIAGYNVRVFCDLLKDKDEESVERLIVSGEFYYLRNFYEHDLINKSECCVRCKIPKEIKMPKYMRDSERKLNGDLFWYIIDVDKEKVIKRFDVFNDELTDLSPDSTWGIDYIKKRWAENFTLKIWNDDLENRWYLDYLKTCEPDKINQFNETKTNDQSPMQKWTKEKRFSEEIVNNVDLFFKIFAQEVSDNKEDLLAVSDAIKMIVENLNELNNKYHFIGEQEREELVEYIYYVLYIYELSDVNDNVDSLRQW